MKHHRFGESFLNGEPCRVLLIRSDKERVDLAPGDKVEYNPPGKPDNVWNDARVYAVLPSGEIHLISLCRCGADGRPRVDNGLSAGVHCDECWDRVVTECRRRSW